MADERQAILRAAEAEFASAGLEGTTLETVASRAGLEAGAVRALFIDKPTLLRELLREKTDPLVSGIALAVSETVDTRELIRKTLELYDLWLMNHPDVVRIITQCVLDGPRSLGELYQQSLLPSEFYEHLQRVIDRGELRCRNLFVLSLLLDSLMIFPHMLRSTLEAMDPESTAEVLIEKRLNAIVDLFDGGLYTK